MPQHFDSHDWSGIHTMPSTSLSYQATTQLDNGHHGHHHHTLESSHSHTYPSQQLSAHASILNPELQAPMLESPSYSQDRESQLSESVHEDDPHSTIPSLPSYHLSHSGIPPTPPQQSNPFKRPYQPEGITPGSSPQHHSGGYPNPKRRKSSAARAEAWTMSDDDTLLLQLKDDEGLPWKVIALRFKEMSRGEFRVPTLQMRYKRLKEKMRVWEAEDIHYLKEAKEYVEKQKWELISQRMMELGCKKKIPGSTCEKKWKEIGPQQPPPTHSGSTTPSLQSHEMKRELSGISDDMDPRDLQ